jgi:hypothetical protein
VEITPIGSGPSSVILLILIGVQIARERIESFEHPVDGPDRDGLHVGFLDVIRFDVRENVGIDA